ncbi:MAG: acyl-CoA dehydrogenase family protein [Mycobacteriales bacterium]
MDFELDEDLLAVRDLAEDIFRDLATVDRVRKVEIGLGGHDPALWSTLATSGLLGIGLPVEAGGAGLGMLGLAVLLEQQGRRVAPVPLWNALAGAALPVAAFGDASQVQRWISPLLTGSHVLAGGFLPDATGKVRRLLAVPDGDGWRLSGRLEPVSGAAVAAAVVVPADLGDRTGVFVVPTGQPRVAVTPLAVTARGSSARLELDEVTVGAEDLLPADGDEVVRWTLMRARTALAAVQAGVCREALSQTAAYTSERHQFGRPLSTNQAVALRAADAHLDTEAIRLTAMRAAWLLDDGDEQAAQSAALVATWWASAGGLRAVHATQHLHGGMGADVDYPIHRYFLWGREIAFTLGTAAAVAAELGDLLPDAPRIGAPA